MATNETFIKMILDRWSGSIDNFNKHLNGITDKQLLREVAPGKNRGIYLLGHLIAVHDDMLVLMDIGEKAYPELQEPFLKQPDKAIADIPSAATLRTYWAEQCEQMKQKFEQLPLAAWFEKHTAV